MRNNFFWFSLAIFVMISMGAALPENMLGKGEMIQAFGPVVNKLYSSSGKAIKVSGAGITGVSYNASQNCWEYLNYSTGVPYPRYANTDYPFIFNKRSNINQIYIKPQSATKTYIYVQEN